MMSCFPAEVGAVVSVCLQAERELHLLWVGLVSAVAGEKTNHFQPADQKPTTAQDLFDAVSLYPQKKACAGKAENCPQKIQFNNRPHP